MTPTATSWRPRLARELCDPRLRESLAAPILAYRRMAMRSARPATTALEVVDLKANLMNLKGWDAYGATDSAERTIAERTFRGTCISNEPWRAGSPPPRKVVAQTVVDHAARWDLAGADMQHEGHVASCIAPRSRRDRDGGDCRPAAVAGIHTVRHQEQSLLRFRARRVRGRPSETKPTGSRRLSCAQKSTSRD